MQISRCTKHLFLGMFATKQKLLGITTQKKVNSLLNTWPRIMTEKKLSYLSEPSAILRERNTASWAQSDITHK